MLETSELKKDGIYMAKVVGEKELYKIKIRNILERTAVVELVDDSNKVAVVKLKDIREAVL
ncbi:MULTISPECIES: hypothetical protein [Enterococcus]|uniref:Uncharacterized protein n=1 Tax=Enterococcus mundtii TaxID=53346 RepID=A0A1V2U9I0_ENTMU|nr:MULTISPECIES: hypothetical protein [Enterococcus]MCA6773582.1 hypothetical protein [Enterococcus mundtii]MDA9429892.1 hypothetical protein [Enterococcus mundtii 1A]NBA63853.1 hypothetical protein [Enterococcus mundtii]NMP58595.1 hypothetical protein [Enterococcus mundtii]ONN39928.1 hypothetical protein BTN92_15975 [Enterococcus mundtii]